MKWLKKIKFVLLIVFYAYAEGSQAQTLQNIYTLPNTFYASKINAEYGEVVERASCKMDEGLHQTQISDLKIKQKRPVAPARLNEIENEANYIAIYKAILCYKDLTKDKINEIFSTIQNDDIAEYFIEQNKTASVKADFYEASFEMTLNKDKLDYLVWKYTLQPQNQKNDTIAVLAEIYSPKDIFYIENCFKSQNIKYKLIKYSPHSASYSLKLSELVEISAKLVECNILLQDLHSSPTMSIIK